MKSIEDESDSEAEFMLPIRPKINRLSPKNNLSSESDPLSPRDDPSPKVDPSSPTNDSLSPKNNRLSPKKNPPLAKLAVCGDASSPIVISELGSEEVTSNQDNSNVSMNANLPSSSNTLHVVTPHLKSVVVKKLKLNRSSTKMKNSGLSTDVGNPRVTTPRRRANQNNSGGNITPTLAAQRSDHNSAISGSHKNSPNSKEPMDGFRVDLTPEKHSSASGEGKRNPRVGDEFKESDTPPLPAVSALVPACDLVKRKTLVSKDIKRNLLHSYDKNQTRKDQHSGLVSDTPSTNKQSNQRVPSVISESPGYCCQSPSSIDTHKATSVDNSSVRSHKIASLSLKKLRKIPASVSLIQHRKLPENSANNTRLSPKGQQGMEVSICEAKTTARSKTPDVEVVALDDTREAVTEFLSLPNDKKRTQNVGDDSSDQSQCKRIKLTDSPKLKVPPSITGPRRDDNSSKNTKQSRPHPPPMLYAHGGISPSDYSRVILNSLNSYLSQLAVAQSAVIHRVRWGKPIKSSSKQTQDSFMFMKCPLKESRWKHALKINPDCTLEGSTMQESHATHDSNDNFIPDKCHGIVQAPDDNSQEAVGDEDERGETILTPAVASQCSCEDFIPLNSYHEESDVEHSCDDALHVNSHEMSVPATQANHQHLEENTASTCLRNSETEMPDKEKSPVLKEQDQLSSSAGKDPEEEHEVIHVSSQGTARGSLSRTTTTTTTGDITVELARDSSSMDHSPLERVKTLDLYRKKRVTRKRRLQDSEDSDAVPSQATSSRLTYDSDVELTGKLNVPGLSSDSVNELSETSNRSPHTEDRPWLSSRKHPNISTVSSAKRPRISKLPTSANRGKEKKGTLKTKVVKKKEARTPRSRKKGSAAARLIKGIIERDPSSESDGFSAVGLHVRRRKDRTPSKKLSRSPIDSSESDDVTFPSKASVTHLLASGGKPQNKW